MKNNVLKIILGTVVVTIALSAVLSAPTWLGDILNTPKGSAFSQKPITELNQTYHGKGINVTATEIKCVDLPDEENSKLVGVNFIIENISNERYDTGKAIGVSYDDFAADEYSRYDVEENLGESLKSQIESGKKSVGYVGILVPSDAKTVEVKITEGLRYDKEAVFVLDIPPVEE